MTSIDELKSLYDTFRKDLHDKVETQSIIEKVITLYENYINNPKIYTDPAIESYFTNTFTSDVIQCLINLSSFKNDDVNR